jgi:VCBS repeat-containing protein
VTPDGSRIYGLDVGSGTDPSVAVLDTGSGTSTSVEALDGRGYLRDFTLAPDGRWLYAVVDDTLYAVDTTNDTLVRL